MSENQKPNTNISTNTRSIKINNNSQMKKLNKNSQKSTSRSTRNTSAITVIN